ncbi:uncharacterized protein C2845_PM03G06120 [Panicum miliaceum]|uniref:RBR-type E3 ubiquitin transferase n=1 Tax=Panicum miliaceum TaxID=4540 RepID=A0A3L6T9M9_PANMI|nr:uncharacterized protein C2845_PM03G06120 [Panicum miliaceum]
MSRKKPPAPAPAVASTGCSGLMSCLSVHRRGPPQPAPREGEDALPRSSDADGGKAADAVERYWKRMQLLEEEIRRLIEWLGQEERPAPPGAKAGKESTGSVVAERARNGANAREVGCSASAATTAATKRCASVGHGASGVKDTVRLEDGSYLREVRRVRVGRPWERLAVQVSRPVVPVDAASASEVLDKMAAMRAEDLCKFLVQMMPLRDITGQQNPGEPVRRTARLSSGDDLLEALVFKAMEKLESLVLEGLKIQMSPPATELATVAADRRRDEAVGKDCMVHVVLVQARDPNERYAAIGDPMIGLIEASLQRKDGAVKQEVQGLHAAGISFINRKPSDGRCMMWSASLRQCKGSHDGGGGGGVDGDSCRCTCVRNPNLRGEDKVRGEGYDFETEDDVRRCQDEVTARMSELLSVPRGFAAAFLRHCRWDAEQLQNEWLSDERRIRGAVGLAAPGRSDVPTALNDRPLDCGICFDRYAPGEMRSAGCPHYYCHECWRGYIGTAVGDGPRCLLLRCPEPRCPAPVVRELVDAVAADEDRARYVVFVVRSYVEEGTSKYVRWCPGPGCTLAVRSRPGSPLPPVPARDREEPGVQPHDVRRPCGHEFCWLCLGSWANHAGDYYHCNRYAADRSEFSGEKAQRRQGRESLERFLHYYERWTAHAASLAKARQDLDGLRGGGLDLFAGAMGVPPTELDFLAEAYAQVIEARRVLRWTYAHVYHLDPARDNVEFCEYLQGEAEGSLERLHHCAEQERNELKEDLAVYAPASPAGYAAGKFAEFREKLSNLNLVTRNHFSKLVEGFESGMADGAS